ncbi:MAG: 23S rRNA (adenine(2503)-C(2))-methyltransferase RlmN [Thermoguttaceae bacterium]|jgi:23S rRNA (adenine2503-C2)-methyltransferase
MSGAPYRFLDLSISEIREILEQEGFPRFRVSQIRRWLFSRKTDCFDAMTDISKADRSKLKSLFGNSVFSGRLLAESKSGDGTRKILIEWPDRHRVEAVLLRDERNHRTGCISTQVGCAMGCRFCASGLDGFVRNLTRGEILEQILRLNMILPEPERLTHLVIMGIGEPTLNLDALLSALVEATSADGLDIGNRRVTISTVGTPGGIDKMTAADLPYKLAISLHAADDQTRTKIVPQNRFLGIKALLEESDRYFKQTGRRVTFEYILIAGVNDSTEDARHLVDLLNHKTAIVNIIPYNPVPGLKWRAPSPHAVESFVKTLTEAGVQVKVRFRKGDDINAACGQLRRGFQGQSTDR